MNIIYWVTTIIISIVFFVTGIGNLIPFEHIAEDMSHLGYPPYFLTILGTWKIFAAITIIFPGGFRLKEWAYAGMMFDLTGAAFSRYSLSDGLQMVMIPLAIAGVVVTSWTLRPK